MTYPLSFFVTTAENKTRWEKPEWTASQIRETAFKGFAEFGQPSNIVRTGSRIEMIFEDGSMAVFAANFDMPTLAYKAQNQIQDIAPNQFNTRDNVGGIQGHSQGSSFPFVVVGIGDNWGVMYANATIICRGLKQACTLSDWLATCKTHLQPDWASRMQTLAECNDCTFVLKGE